MLARITAWFRFRREIGRINNRAAKVAKLTLANKHLIEHQHELIQNLQKEAGAAVLRESALEEQIAGLKKQFAELRKHIATAEPAKLQAIRATSWGNYRKLIGEEDFDVPA